MGGHFKSESLVDVHGRMCPNEHTSNESIGRTWGTRISKPLFRARYRSTSRRIAVTFSWGPLDIIPNLFGGWGRDGMSRRGHLTLRRYLHGLSWRGRRGDAIRRLDEVLLLLLLLREGMRGGSIKTRRNGWRLLIRRFLLETRKRWRRRGSRHRYAFCALDRCDAITQSRGDIAIAQCCSAGLNGLRLSRIRW